MIKLQIIGRIGKDATLNQVNGKNVINFSVAHSERYKDNTGNEQERTVWAECAYWTERTAVLPYLTKGTQVFVEGNPDVRTYPKGDGSTGASLTVRVREVQLLGSKSDNPQPQATAAPVEMNARESTMPQPSAADFSSSQPDDLPF
jgi:single-strand DNA-binding protein